jgi:hypothetical protein
VADKGHVYSALSSVAWRTEGMNERISAAYWPGFDLFTPRIHVKFFTED